MLPFLHLPRTGLLLLVLVMLASGTSGWAQATFTYDGSGAWNSAGNWTKVGTSTSTYPGQGNASQQDHVVIPSGNLNPNTNYTSGNIRSITVSGTGILNMATRNMTVNGNVTITSTATDALLITTGDLSMAGGTLSTSTGIEFTGDGTITAAALTINSGGSVSMGTASSDITLTGLLSCAGPITNAGSGVITAGSMTVSAGTSALSGTSGLDINGTLTISGGTLNLSNSGATTPDLVTMTGGTLGVSGSTNVNTPGAVSLQGGSATFAGTSILTAPSLTMSNAATCAFSSSGTSTISGAVTLGATNTLTVSGGILSGGSYSITGSGMTMTAGQVTCLGNFSCTGTFAGTGGTFNLNGTTADAALSGTLNVGNLTINKTGRTITTSGAVTVSTATTLTAGTVTLGANLNTGSSFNANGGTLNAGSNTVTSSGVSGAGAITFGSGAWNINGNNGHSGTFTCGTSTVTYGSAGQNVQGYNTGGYNNLVISGTGTKTLQNALRVNGTMTLSASTFTENNLAATIGTLAIGGGTYTDGTAATTVTTFNLNSGAFNGAASGTNTLNAGTMAGGSFSSGSATNNFTSLTQSAGAVTVNGGTVSVDNNLAPTGGSIAQSAGTLDLKGNFTPTSYSATGGTLQFSNGTPAGNVTIGSALSPYSLTINKPGRTVFINGALSANAAGTTTITAGTVDMAANVNTGSSLVLTGGALDLNAFTLTSAAISGNGTAVNGASGIWNISGAWTGTAPFTAGTSSVNYTGAAQAVRGTTYYTLGISGSATKTLGAALTVTNNMNVTASTFTENNLAVTINTLNISGGAYTDGTGTNNITFINLSGGTYTGATTGTNTLGNVNITGGTFSAGNGSNSMNRMDVAGGTFTDGTGTLNIGNLYVFSGTYAGGAAGSKIISRATLLGSTMAAGNAAYTYGAMYLTGGNYTDGTGAFSADSVNIYTGTFTGAASGTNGINVFTMTGGTFNSGAGTNNLTNADLTAGTLNVTGGTTTIDSDFAPAGGAVTQSGGTLDLQGSFTNAGAYSATGGTLRFSNGTPLGNISIGASLNPYSLTIDKSGRTVTVTTGFSLNPAGTLTMANGTLLLNDDLNTGGTFTFSGGTVTLNGQTLTSVNVNGAGGTMNGASGGIWNISGNNTHTGSFTPGTSTVNYTGASQNIAGYNTAGYHQLVLSGSGTKTLQTDLRVTGTMVCNSGTTLAENGQDAVIATLDINGGTYTDGTGTTAVTTLNLPSGTFNGTAVSTNTFGTVNIYGGTFNTSNGTQSVTGTTTISGGALSITNGNYTGLNYLVSAPGQIAQSNGTLSAQGSFNYNGTFAPTGGTFQLTGTSADANVTGILNLRNFTIDKAGRTVALNGNITVNPASTFQLTDGTVNLGAAFNTGATFNAHGGTLNLNSHTLTSDDVTSLFYILGWVGTTINGGSGTWNIAGNNNHYEGFLVYDQSAHFVPGTSTVNYTGAGQTVQGYSQFAGNGYYNMNISGSGTKTLQNALTVNRRMTVSGATFTENNKAVNITTLNLTGGVYTDGTGTNAIDSLLVPAGTYNGAATGTNNFGYALISNTGTLTANNCAYNIPDYNITGGTITDGTGTLTVNTFLQSGGTYTGAATGSNIFNKSLTVTGSTMNAGNGTYTINLLNINGGTYADGTGTQTIDTVNMTTGAFTGAATGTNTIEVINGNGGTWNGNSGTYTVNKKLNANTGSVYNAGNGTQTVNVMNIAGGAYTDGTGTNVTDTINITSGTWTGAATGTNTIEVVNASGGTFTGNLGTYTVNKKLNVNMGGNYVAGNGTQNFNVLNINGGTYVDGTGTNTIDSLNHISGSYTGAASGTNTVNTVTVTGSTMNAGNGGWDVTQLMVNGGTFNDGTGTPSIYDFLYVVSGTFNGAASGTNDFSELNIVGGTFAPGASAYNVGGDIYVTGGTVTTGSGTWNYLVNGLFSTTQDVEMTTGLWDISARPTFGDGPLGTITLTNVDMSGPGASDRLINGVVRTSPDATSKRLLIKGDITNNGQIIQNANTFLEFQGATMAPSALTFGATGNLVLYSRNGAQTIKTASSYYDLDMRVGGLKTTDGNLDVLHDVIQETATFTFGSAAHIATVAGSYTTNANLTFLNGNTLDVNGNFSQTAGTLNLAGPNSTIFFGSDFTGTGTFTQAGGRVVYDRATGSQSVRALTYDRLETANGASKVLAGNTAVTGTFTTGGGSTELNNFGLTLNGALVRPIGGTGTIGGGSTLAGNTSSLVFGGTTGGTAGVLYPTAGSNHFNMLGLSRTGSTNGTPNLIINGDMTSAGYAFANDAAQTFRVRIWNNSTFTLAPPTAAGTSLFAAGNASPRKEKFFTLQHTNSFFKYAPQIPLTAATAYTLPVGMDTHGPVEFRSLDSAMGTATVTSGSAAVTGAGSSFLFQQSLSDSLRSAAGVYYGRISAIASATGLTLGANASVSASPAYLKVTQSFRPIVITPAAGSLASPSITVGFRNHSGGVTVSPTNLPRIVGNQRTDHLIYLDVQNFGGSGGPASLSLDFSAVGEGDFTGSVLSNSLSAFRNEGGAWTKYLRTTPAANSPLATGLLRVTRSSIDMNGAYYYVVGASGGDLPQDPEFIWTGGAGNGLWNDPDNWAGTPAALFEPNSYPKDLGHNVTINGGSGNITISAGDSIAVSALNHKANTLTVNGTLAIFGNYNYNFPLLTGQGAGTIALTNGEDIVGTGTAFTSELVAGTRLYYSDGTFAGIVKSITDDSNLKLANPGSDLNDIEDRPANTFNYINPTFGTVPGAISSGVAGCELCLTNVGGVFNENYRGRVLTTSAGVYIGTVASYESPTRIRLVDAPAVPLSGATIKVASGVDPSGTGQLISGSTGKVSYWSNGPQNMAYATYNDLTIADTRATYVTGSDGIFFTTIPQTRQEVTVNRHFRGRFWKQATAMQGTRFTFGNNSVVSVYTTPYLGSDFSKAWPLNTYAHNTDGNYTTAAVRVGTLPTHKVNVRLHNSTGLGIPNATLNSAEMSVMNKVKDMTITGSAMNVTGFSIPDGGTFDISGTLTLQGTGAVGSGTFLKLGQSGGAALPATLILRGNFNALDGVITNGGFGPFNKSAIELHGTGAFTSDPMASLTGPMSRIVLNRTGATVTAPVNAAGAVTVNAGTLNLPGVSNTLDADYLRMTGGVMNIPATTVTVAPERQDLNGYNGINMTGGVMNLTGTNATLSLDSTNLLLSGTGFINTNTSTVEFVHTDFSGANGFAQTISANTLSGLTLTNLRINKPAGAGNVTVAAGTVKVRENVLLPATNGVNLVTGAGNLTLMSTATTTARIPEIQGGGLSGSNFTLQRKTPNTIGWYFLASPVIGLTPSGVQNIGILTNPVNNASGAKYLENDTTSEKDMIGNTVFRDGWHKFTNGSEPIAVGQGFRAYARASFIGGGATLATTGAMTTGNKAVGFTFTPTAPGGYDGGGWNLLGNPYPSEIDWNAVKFDGLNAAQPSGNAVSIYNPVTQVYASYTATGPGTGIAVNGGSRYIASSQAFFVKASGAGTLTFREAHKNAANPGTFLRTDEPANVLRFTLSQNGRHDEAALALHAGASLGCDAFDAENMAATNGVDLASATPNGSKLAINFLPELDQRMEIPLPFTLGADGQATIAFTGMESFGSDVRLMLRDRYTGTLRRLTPGLVYSFSVSADPATRRDDRLSLVLDPGTATGTKARFSLDVSAWPNPAHSELTVSITGTRSGKATLQVVDLNGRTVLTQVADGNLDGIRLDLAGLKAGLYNLRVQADREVHVQKLVVE